MRCDHCICLKHNNLLPKAAFVAGRVAGQTGQTPGLEGTQSVPRSIEHKTIERCSKLQLRLQDRSEFRDRDYKEQSNVQNESPNVPNGNERKLVRRAPARSGDMRALLFSSGSMTLQLLQPGDFTTLCLTARGCCARAFNGLEAFYRVWRRRRFVRGSMSIR